MQSVMELMDHGKITIYASVVREEVIMWAW
jgi:hypothetical protein